MARAPRNALAAGIVPRSLPLPGGLLGTRRIVHITPERIAHIAKRRPGWATFALVHLAEVLAKPDYLGYRPRVDRRRVEFVRRVGPERRYLLVAVKFLDPESEAWVSTAHPLHQRDLTRRVRNGTMQAVSRGP